jgi:hypothetical protein
VLGFETERAHRCAQVRHANGVVAEGSGREAVGARRGEQGIVGGVLEVIVVTFGCGGASKKLVEYVVWTLLVSETIEPRFVKTKSKDLGGTNAATVVEVEFEVATVTRRIGAHESLGISKRIENGAESLDLLSDFCFSPRVTWESENLIEE